MRCHPLFGGRTSRRVRQSSPVEAAEAPVVISVARARPEVSGAMKTAFQRSESWFLRPPLRSAEESAATRASASHTAPHRVRVPRYRVTFLDFFVNSVALGCTSRSGIPVPAAGRPCPARRRRRLLAPQRPRCSREGLLLSFGLEAVRLPVERAGRTGRSISIPPRIRLLRSSTLHGLAVARAATRRAPTLLLTFTIRGQTS